ncbi:MAG TPA: hypothetical protein VK906_12860 [Egicoccus sp.]|nr:hypothetical protein [Egicoccus sp.]HSK24067.1 hypothetical protein [Egicoccus sp.]
MDATTSTPVSRRRIDAFRAAGDGLSAIGAVLVLLGLFRALIVLDVVPDEAGSWWPAALLLVAAWLVTRGLRAPALTMGTIGTGLLIVTNVPGEYIWPALLIFLGVLLVGGTVTGRRWLADFPGIEGVAVFGDRDLRLAPGEPLRPLVALFGETEGELVGPRTDGESLRCLALFGECTLTVPRDLVVEVSPLAVFGDGRTPEPPTTAAAPGRVRVRATSVFGDVRILRA